MKAGLTRTPRRKASEESGPPVQRKPIEAASPASLPTKMRIAHPSLTPPAAASAAAIFGPFRHKHASGSGRTSHVCASEAGDHSHSGRLSTLREFPGPIGRSSSPGRGRRWAENLPGHLQILRRIRPSGDRGNARFEVLEEPTASGGRVPPALHRQPGRGSQQPFWSSCGREARSPLTQLRFARG